MKNGLTITELTIRDVKRITAVDITPEDGKPIILTGDNAQGKSSVLDGILTAVTGQGLEDPIRHGRQKGLVRLTIGGQDRSFTVEKTFTKSGASLKIVGDDGQPVPKMQTFLNSLVGQLAFDPLEFAGMKPKEQADALRQACGLDTSDLDEKRKELYAERTVANRKAKEAETMLSTAPKPAPGTPETEVSAAEAMAALDALNERQRAVENAEQVRKNAVMANSRAQQDVEAARQAIDQLERQLKAAREVLADAKNDAEESAELLQLAAEKSEEAKAAGPNEDEFSAARSAIENLDKVNAEVRKGKKLVELRKLARTTQAEAEKLDGAIKELDEQRAERIRSANLPIEGMELADDHVLYEGTVFSQLSTAEQTRISTMVAMAQNPELKVIMIREGALINRANMAMIAEMAAERGYQVWVEKFQEEPSDTGLHIEDGSITHINGKEVEQDLFN